MIRTSAHLAFGDRSPRSRRVSRWPLPSRSLRRHDPDQVLRSAAPQPPSQSGPTGLPRVEVQLSAQIRCTGCDRPPAGGSGQPDRVLEDQMTSSGPARIVVAGGGLAGLRTIEELRALGYAGRDHDDRSRAQAALRPAAAFQAADEGRGRRHLAAGRARFARTRISGSASAPSSSATESSVPTAGSTRSTGW